MLELALLRRLVVVRHDLQLAVGPDAARELRQLDGFGGGVGAAAGHDGHAFGGLFNRHADDFAVFFDRDGGRFARGADDADAVGAFGDVPVDQLLQRVDIQRAVPERRDEGDERPLEHDTLPAFRARLALMKSRGTYRAARRLPSFPVADAGMRGILREKYRSSRRS